MASANDDVSSDELDVSSGESLDASTDEPSDVSSENLDIPKAVPKPNFDALTKDTTKAARIIVFDLQTTGLGNPHIIQWCAVDYASGNEFATYIKPKIPISEQAETLTKIKIDGNGQMTYNDEQVESVSFSKAVEDFLEYLGEGRSIMCAHNGKRFDFRILISALCANNLLDRFRDKVIGFVDTIAVVKKKLPGRDSYRQEALVRDVLDKKYMQTYEAHNAVNDVRALVNILKLLVVEPEDVFKKTFAVNAIIESISYNKEKRKNIKSLNPLVDKRVCTKNFAGKIAGSGLNMCHLQAIYDENGEVGLRETFVSLNCSGKPRVTNTTYMLDKVVPKLCKYLSK